MYNAYGGHKLQREDKAMNKTDADFMATKHRGFFKHHNFERALMLGIEILVVGQTLAIHKGRIQRFSQISKALKENSKATGRKAHSLAKKQRPTSVSGNS